jgi:hypothetical protein
MGLYVQWNASVGDRTAIVAVLRQAIDYLQDFRGVGSGNKSVPGPVGLNDRCSLREKEFGLRRDFRPAAFAGGLDCLG